MSTKKTYEKCQKKSLKLKKSDKIAKNLKKLPFFFFKKSEILREFFLWRKEKKTLLSQFSNIKNMRFDQSSPVQPVSESRGGGPSVTEEDERTKDGNPCV